MSKQVSDSDLEAGRLYPPQKHIQNVSVKIATEISKYYYKIGTATLHPVPTDLEEYIRKQLYDTKYTSYLPSTWKWPEEHEKPRSYDQVKK